MEEHATAWLVSANMTRLLRDLEAARVMLRLPRNCGPEARGKLAAEAAAAGLAAVAGTAEEQRLQQQVGFGGFRG